MKCSPNPMLQLNQRLYRSTKHMSCQSNKSLTCSTIFDQPPTLEETADHPDDIFVPRSWSLMALDAEETEVESILNALPNALVERKLSFQSKM